MAIAAQLTGNAEAVHHHELIGGHRAAWVALGLFLVAWPIHVTAMMLPSTLPLARLFHRVTATRERPARTRAAFLAGYAVVWGAFGLVALVADAGLHQVTETWAWLHDRSHLIAGAALVTAGAFQFSGLKDRCLRVCRHPAVFLQSHYRRGLGGAFALGRRHGLYCLGCCWALMLVMFAVGIANLAWMAPLALVMYYEKAGVHGERIVAPVGAGLVAVGALVLLNPVWLPTLLPG